jgi:protein-export SecD/SecF family membrane protein
MLRHQGGYKKMAKGIGKLFIAMIVIAVLCYSATYGLTIGQFKTHPVFDSEFGIRKGFDLAGGSVIVYKAMSTKDESGKQTELTPTADQMNTAKSILDRRLTRMGYTEGTVTIKGNELEVELPSVNDTAKAIKEIGQTAKLTFEEPAAQGEASGKVVMSGSDIVSAKREYTQADTSGKGGNVVKVVVTSDASKRFSEATGRLVNQRISIKLDTEVISAPTVNSQINDTNFIIQGEFTQQSADELAALINDGQLPFNLEVAQQRTAGATLGESALQTSTTAALIGLILIFIFMIGFYRLPGLIASIALIGYTAIVAIILAAIRINLSLPGVAGVILSIGMAVDANVIIFERMKDEFRRGKTLKAALDAGFQRAMVAIIDSNVTTLIAAAVVYFIGSGPIKGFAITLGVGVIISMFTAITATKFLLKAVIELNIRNKFLYGAPLLKGGNENV